MTIKNINNDCKFFDSTNCECFDALNGENLCILHSENEYKNQELFKTSFDIYIERCKKNKYFNFSNITFVSKLDLKNFIFEHKVSFSHCVFNSSFSIKDSSFMDSVSFIESFFKEGFYLDNIEFNLPSFIFDDCSFYKDAYFENIKGDRGEFSFRKCVFNSYYRFKNSNFNKTFIISNCSFKGICSFWIVKFSSNFSMEETNFKELCFYKVSFDDSSYFSSNFFGDKIEFLISKFSSTIYFCGNKQKNKVIFQNTKVVFSNCLGSDKLVFRNADLKKCSFSNTDIRKTEFTNVIWSRKYNRIVLYDEECIENDKKETFIGELFSKLKQNKEERKDDANFEYLEKLYRELKQNSEDRKDYILAGEFNISEKEMKLKNSKTDLSIKILLLLYKNLSRYNESIKLPILWILFIILYSSLNFYILNFDGLIPLNYKELNFTLFLSSFHESLRAFLITQKALDETITSTWIYTLEKTISPILLAMLGLTINQKLKR